MKSILFVSPNGILQNGAERTIYDLMRYLTDSGYRVFNAFSEYKKGTNTKYRNAMAEKGIVPIGIRYLTWWPDAPDQNRERPADSIRDRIAIRLIRKAISRNKIDIVISNTVNVYHGAIAASREKVRHIWLIHEFPEREFAYYRNKIKFISDHSDAVFSVGGALNECLNSLFIDKHVGAFFPYSSQGNNLSTVRSGSKARVVSIGTIAERKNQIELLEAFSLIPEDMRRDLELVFIGDYEAEYKQRFDQIVSENDYKVTCLGFKDTPWEYVTDKDIVVLTSKMESFPCVCTEALMLGVPVVASDNKGFKSIYELFGHVSLYPLGNVKALADEIIDLLSNFEEKKRSVVDAQEEVRRSFRVDTAYADLIKEISEDKPVSNKPRYSSKELNALVNKD